MNLNCTPFQFCSRALRSELDSVKKSVSKSGASYSALLIQKKAMMISLLKAVVHGACRGENRLLCFSTLQSDHQWCISLAAATVGIKISKNVTCEFLGWSDFQLKRNPSDKQGKLWMNFIWQWFFKHCHDAINCMQQNSLQSVSYKTRFLWPFKNHQPVSSFIQKNVSLFDHQKS